MKNYEIEIKKLGINGEGIGYLNKTVTFVPNALPGELVQIYDVEQFKGYNKAKVSKIIRKSPDRIKPKCPIYNKCQVCSIMPLRYDKQVLTKKYHFQDTVLKYAGTKIKVDQVIKDDNQFGYRNSIKLPVFNLHDKLAIGIHQRDTNHFVYLKDCIVQDPNINRTTNEVLAILDEYRYRAYDRKTKIGLRYLLVRSFADEIMITFVVGKNTRIVEEALDRIKSLPNMVSINQTTNTKGSNEIIVEPVKNLVGKKSINVPFNGFNFKLSPTSFMQLNTPQAIKMYDVIKEYLGNDNNLVLDLFCGVGTIACYINEQAQHIIGVDNNKAAIKDAKENVKKHRLGHIEFIADDVDKVIKNIAKKSGIDAIIVDPPRTGLTEFTIESIIKSKAKKLIYVSCNPSTFAKDLALLQRYYDVSKASIVDMFPQTMHVESVVLLTRKGKK